MYAIYDKVKVTRVKLEEAKVQGDWQTFVPTNAYILTATLEDGQMWLTYCTREETKTDIS